MHLAPKFLYSGFFAAIAAVVVIESTVFVVASKVEKQSPLTIDPQVVDLGECVAGTTKPFELRITNQRDEAIRIVGGTTGCACVATVGLPILIQPGETGVVPVTARMPTIFDNSAFHQVVTLFGGSDKLLRLEAEVRATVVEAVQ